MTAPNLKVKVVRKAQIKLKVMPRFPSSVTVESPLLLDRTGGSYGFSLDQDAVNAGTYLDASHLTSGTLPAARLAASGKKRVTLVSGQSNPENSLTYAWSPNANAFIWNGGREGVVGTAFGALDSANILLGAKIVSDLADATLTSAEYLINVVQSGTAISHWLTGTGAPDVYATLKREVEAALAVLGLSHVDNFIWWQGESDNGSSTYTANLTTLITRLRAETWFPRETPILLYGLCSDTQAGVSGYEAISLQIASVAAADPDFIKYFYTPSFVGTTYWQASPNLHMTAQGYFSAGAAGAHALMNGARPSVPGAVYDPTPSVLTPWRFDNNIAVGAVAPVSGTVRAILVYGAGAGNNAGTFVAGINGGATSWAIGNLSSVTGGGTAYDNSLLINSTSYAVRFFAPAPAAGTKGALIINGASSGAGAGEYIAGSNGVSTDWSIGGYSAINGGAYDATMTLESANGYRFFGLTAGLVTSSSNGTLSVTAIPGNTTTFLRGDGTFAAVVGADVALTNTHIFVGNASNVAADVAVSGDATLANTGALTLATVATAGTTGSSTAIPVITINAKGLTTSITTVAVIAPAGTLTGATLAAGVTASSLTSLGTLSSLTMGGTLAMGSNSLTSTGTITSGAHTITSASANSLVVGANGATNPVLQVDDSAASVVTGWKMTGNALAGGAALAVISSGSNEPGAINAKGSGSVNIGNSSTGGVGLGAAGGGVTISSALTYGGVTLSNAVTGTGNMALSASPTFTGTLTAATITPTTINAFTLGGTIAGGGNQLNNIIIGTSTPLAITGTTITGNTSISSPIHTASGALTFQSNGSTLAGTITTGQKWGIGTETNPQGLFVASSNVTTGIAVPLGTIAAFNGTDGASAFFALQTFSTGGNPAVFMRAARGTAASPTASQAGDVLGFYSALGYAATAYDTASQSGMYIGALNNHSLTDNTTFFAFLNVTSGTTRAETARIQSGLSVGTTSDPGSGLIYTNSASFLMRTKTSLTGGGTGSVPTLTAGPAAGNPTKWLPYDDNGTTRYIPAW